MELRDQMAAHLFPVLLSTKLMTKMSVMMRIPDTDDGGAPVTTVNMPNARGELAQSLYEEAALEAYSAADVLLRARDFKPANMVASMVEAAR